MSSSPIRPLQEYENVETTRVLKALVRAHKALGELKGLALSMPNQNILLSTLSLQEAKESSAIENIITTQDDLYQSNYLTQEFTSSEAKEVHSYAKALKVGFELVTTTGLLTNSSIIKIQQTIENNNAGFRKQAGTTLINNKTKDIIYTPPQSEKVVLTLMGELEQFINTDDLSDYDVLTKMAMIHHQFESIHPFYDGNGRTGRIINILYLTKQNILGTPILYLSRFINQNKDEYYKLLQSVRESENWEPWLLYMLKALEVTALDTSKTIQDLILLMQEYKQTIKVKLPKIYSHELINNLFSHPYTKNEFLVEELGIHRNTARRYLDSLVVIGLLKKEKIGNQNFYINKKLFILLS